ncbi:UPF0721 transmembrane protein [Gordonia spumicola]|uniref:Probable membrane transporter protein n=1 Tax=Gordonia spumicola TaxID=589161 RepID=A0A7I9VE79_9ACTN|nr:sulfite exporter TauE/SafE family protein [Gordonia spumicola]GEE03656.1 UPF0721 transmembrane protein [Gordonia spumicola]
MSVAQFVLLIGAGFAAGLIGYLTGLASLVSYPALLAIGLSPVSANVTNTVAMVAVGGGAVAKSAPELAKKPSQMRVLGLMGVLGGVVGAIALLVAPGESFEAVVPVLIAIASVSLLCQPFVRGLAGGRRFPVLYPIAVFVVAVYGGYFGAGAGVMILAVTLTMSAEPLWRAAMLKSYVLSIANLVAAIGFAFFGPVHWTAALAMAIGGFAGGYVGPPVVERINPTLLRVVVSVCGLGLAAWLARGWV